MDKKRSREDYKYEFRKNRPHELYNEFYMQLYSLLFEFNIKYEKLEKRKKEFNIYNKYKILENEKSLHIPIIYKCINYPLRDNISYKDSLIEMENIVPFIHKLKRFIFIIDDLINNK